MHGACGPRDKGALCCSYLVEAGFLAGGPLGDDRHLQYGGWRRRVSRDLGRPFSQEQDSSFWSVLRNLLYPEDAVTDTLAPELSHWLPHIFTYMSQTEGRKAVQSLPHPVSPGSVHGNPNWERPPALPHPSPIQATDTSGWRVLFLFFSSPSLG